MKIRLNDQPLELAQPLSVSALLEQLERQQPGTALAINQIIIPRTDWANHLVQDGDDILLFQAIAGG
ncbi:Thiamine biosynthesis protein ThiS [Serratia quinivorans]|jgi:sulfur carrier protein|uniref:Sulfur carrier protein ThiS n=1 Tax=Serratia quinivorans TaxID=137545 RepID=A0A379ZDD2_9GAMM|nr:MULTISPECIES: sulfur carrier protein ThiS [Serratia]MCS4269490.1 sulfur carrier protein [Serratia sp. BIGb0163]RYM59859.1 sulfur carrier protein ThiS [Serratia proteamaculans]CAI1216604.1 Thiamine biosynthesis protein ThiS [Serratia quinivorans]CAI1979268.1 Thiamine biosynthesis protein ThiS [Serratia quinivorans]CAI1990549.1 Thiamine biosynthesis protein ThiS [Serratia quinivorans]